MNLSYVLDYVFNKAAPTWSTAVGAFLIMFAVVGATVHSLIEETEEHRESALERAE